MAVHASIARLSALWVTLGVMLGAAACDRTTSRQFSGPSPVGPALIRVDGPPQVAPGGSVSLTAHVVRSGAPSTEVTRAAEWTSRNPEVLTVDAGGVARAHAIGDVVVEARHEGLVGLFGLRVLPDGTYVVTGAVIPALGARRARVEATWAGQILVVETHPDDGSYRLLGVVGALRLTASLDGYKPQSVDLDVQADRRHDFRLSIDVEAPAWTLEVTPSPSCADVPGFSSETLRAEVAFVIHSTLALAVPIEQPDVLFEGQAIGAELTLLFGRLGTGLLDDDLYPPSLRMRSASGKAFDVLLIATGRRVGAGYAGEASGYLGQLQDPGSSEWAARCSASDHRFTLMPP